MVRLLAVAALLVLFFLSLTLSTEFVAAALHHASALGPPWATFGTTPLYPPWTWVGWSTRFERSAPDAFRTASALTTGGAVLGLAVVAAATARRGRAKTSTAHGSARWATAAEMRKAGLLGKTGVVLCQTSDARYTIRTRPRGQRHIRLRRTGRLVRHDGPEHVFCFAPTRSGKGVGLVIPTLLAWPHSVLVYDIKKENWGLMAGWRRQFSRVWRFEPTAGDSLRFNPLLEIRKGLHEVKDTQNVADLLVDPTGEKETRDDWQITAHGLLTGAILHVLYAEADKTLSGVAAFLSDPCRRQFDTLRRMLETRHLGTAPHPAVAQAGREMVNKSDNERSGVMSTALACLGLYRDPVVGRATSASDFRIAEGAHLPYRARKVRYFLDPRFRERDTIPAPLLPPYRARGIAQLCRSYCAFVIESCTRRDALLALCSAVVPACAPAAGSGSPPADPIARSTSRNGPLVEIESRIGGRVGVFATDTETGRTLAHRESERFAMCSTFKWTLAAAVLRMVDRAATTLGERLAYGKADLLEYAPVASQHVAEGGMTIEALARAAVTVSDNTAANLLLGKVGGPAGLTQFFRALGDRVTRLDRSEPALNSNDLGEVRDTTSPLAMVGLMRTVLCGDALSRDSRERLLGWMQACETGQNRLRAGLPPSWTVGDKTGTGLHGACNDVAIALPPGRAPILVAAYLSDGPASGARLEAAHAQIATLVSATLR